jgi:hypothetical protein
MKKLLVILFTVTAITAAQEYKVEMNIEGGAKDMSETNKVEYIVKDADGNAVYSVLKEVNYDVPYPVAQAYNDGSLVLVRAADTKIWFYNPQGEMVKEGFLFEKLKVNYERTIHTDASKEKAALLIADPTIKEKSKLRIYDNRGELLVTREIEGNMGNGVKLSPNGEFSAVSVSEWKGTELVQRSVVLDQEMNNIKEFSHPFTWGEFSEDENRFLGYNNKSLFLADLESGNVLTRKKLTDQIFADAELKKGEILTAVRSKAELRNGKWVSRKFSINRFNQNGELIESKEVDKVEFSEIELIDNNRVKVDNEIKSVR